MLPTPYQVIINHLPAYTLQQVHELVDKQLGDLFPAMALTVIKDDVVVFDGAWGWVDPDTRRYAVQCDSRFDIASITKLFTTTAFLTLVSAGAVTLDTPLVDVVPEFGDIAPRPIDGGQDPHSKQYLPTPDDLQGQTVDPSQVTFRQLLTHTAGLPPWRDVFNIAGPAPTPPEQASAINRQERWQNALKALCQYAFVGHPGDGVVRYSDIGLMLLGEAVSRLHGTAGDLETAIQQRVLERLGTPDIIFNPVSHHGLPLHHTIPTENDPTWRKRRVWGDVHDENACGVGGVAGHAGLFATARDIAIFGQAWLHPDATFGLDQALAQVAIREQATTGNQRRGLGFDLKSATNSSAGDLFSMNAFGHTGFTGTSLWIDPDNRLVVALLTNSVYPGRGKMGTHQFRRDVHTALADGLHDK